ncbi:sensor domain-containing diguanylate cyclase [Telmatospirillum sp. J64-1]|uniref:sensor domain-containing diguanylate cyclase n=1 Tax=Telmatospirillum sp. J64-1 TaxID=2502183 RepID=UPI0021044C42|nr:sensor domain-containing diguanylate cyclase [Telmatospirillum sp. J64-1]
MDGLVGDMPQKEVDLGVSLQGLAALTAPAFLVTSPGRVQWANAAAEELARLYEAGGNPDLSVAISYALAARRSGTEPVSAAGPEGLRHYELTLLPVAARAPEDGTPDMEGLLVLARDSTLERNLCTALVESRQRYKDLVEVSSDFAWEIGPDGRFVFVSSRGALGYRPEEMIGRSPSDFVIDLPGTPGPSPFLTTVSVEEAEIWMRDIDGRQACLIAAAAPLTSAAGEWRGARGVCRDVTLERARDAALARANNRERLITHIVRTIRDVVDPADMLAAAAQATARALGANGCAIYRSGEKGDLKLAACWGETADASAILPHLRARDHYEGRLLGCLVLAAVSRYRRNVNGAVVLWRDSDRLDWTDDERLLIDEVANQIGIANEQIANHERILQLSRTDSLTGLFNRRAFFEELGRRFSRLSRDNRSAALIYVDLDNFKLVNDIHGHQRGDEALLAVRDLLVSSTRPIDLVARLGGDEFAIWLEGADEKTAVMRGNALLEAAEGLSCFSGDAEHPLLLSLGIAVYDPSRNETLEQLIARADEAMYAGKRAGKGACRLAVAAAEG